MFGFCCHTGNHQIIKSTCWEYKKFMNKCECEWRQMKCFQVRISSICWMSKTFITTSLFDFISRCSAVNHKLLTQWYTGNCIFVHIYISLLFNDLKYIQSTIHSSTSSLPLLVLTHIPSSITPIHSSCFPHPFTSFPHPFILLPSSLHLPSLIHSSSFPHPFIFLPSSIHPPSLIPLPTLIHSSCFPHPFILLPSSLYLLPSSIHPPSLIHSSSFPHPFILLPSSLHLPSLIHSSSFPHPFTYPHPFILLPSSLYLLPSSIHLPSLIHSSSFPCPHPFIVLPLYLYAQPFILIPSLIPSYSVGCLLLARLVLGFGRGGGAVISSVGMMPEMEPPHFFFPLPGHQSILQHHLISHTPPPPHMSIYIS